MSDAPPPDRRSRQRTEMARLAVEIVENDGLAGLQARRIAERADCAVGTVYNLFGDLDGVIIAANEETLREIMAACSEALAQMDQAGAAEDRLIALARAYASYAEAHPKRFDALFTHRAAADREFPESFTKLTDDLFALLGRVFADATAPMDAHERDVAARALWASVHGIVTLGLQDRVGLLTREEIAPAIGHIVKAAVRGMAAR
ncbi:TetR/AcrR family transcriptional regulator [Terrarubrum flagellatum]|uniref:TetR/AcrR family transcriptional regulator n=1 Tax=Terrirubrum flagellatum TaxID=2895980 RepID=UPI00314567BF